MATYNVSDAQILEAADRASRIAHDNFEFIENIVDDYELIMWEANSAHEKYVEKNLLEKAASKEAELWQYSLILASYLAAAGAEHIEPEQILEYALDDDERIKDFCYIAAFKSGFNGFYA